MNILIYSNCQGQFIYNWLKDLPYFKDANMTYIANYDITFSEKNIKPFTECDLILYQPVGIHNGIRNTEDISSGVLKYLKDNCIKICFPSLYTDMWCIYEDTGVYIGGEVIDKYRHLNIQQILELYDNNLFDFNLKDRFNKSIEYMKMKESKYCNIKASDFILQYYKYYRLFDTQNHPTGILGAFIAFQICKYLGIDQPDINIFEQEDIRIHTVRWKDSKYIKNELDINYIQSDTISNDNHYRELIKLVYHNPFLIKRKSLNFD